jgi:hypothetical protein
VGDWDSLRTASYEAEGVWRFGNDWLCLVDGHSDLENSILVPGFGHWEYVVGEPYKWFNVCRLLLRVRLCSRSASIATLCLPTVYLSDITVCYCMSIDPSPIAWRPPPAPSPRTGLAGWAMDRCDMAAVERGEWARIRELPTHHRTYQLHTLPYTPWPGAALLNLFLTTISVPVFLSVSLCLCELTLCCPLIQRAASTNTARQSHAAMLPRCRAATLPSDDRTVQVPYYCVGYR